MRSSDIVWTTWTATGAVRTTDSVLYCVSTLRVSQPVAAVERMSATAIADGSVQEEHGLDEGYLAWAVNDMGVIVHHPLRVGSMPGREERGVFCQQDIPAESIVVSVPWEVSPVRHITCACIAMWGNTAIRASHRHMLPQVFECIFEIENPSIADRR